MKPHFNQNNPPGRWRIVGEGFTLLEVVATVAVVSVIAGVGIFAGSKDMGASKSAKLESDVATLHTAVNLYFSSGGSLDDVTLPEDVSDVLKSTTSVSDSNQFAGAPPSWMIERHITSVMRGGNEAETGEPRAGSTMASSPDGTWIWDTGCWEALPRGGAATGATTNPGGTPESVTVDPTCGDVNYTMGGDTNWTLWAGVPVPVISGKYLYTNALTKDPELDLDNYTNSGKYVGLVESFYGTTVGLWTDPKGGVNLVSEIANSADVSEFSHGDTRLDLGAEIFDAGVRTRISYEPKPIEGVAPNQRFEMGTLLMRNGTTFNDSEATKVNLQISIDLREDGGMQSFTIPFALENTENSDDRDASADIIQLLSTNTPVSPVVGGVRYNLVLSIGIADDNGFTQGSKFLVYEGATATGTIYGEFVPSY